MQVNRNQLQYFLRSLVVSIESDRQNQAPFWCVAPCHTFFQNIPQFSLMAAALLAGRQHSLLLSIRNIIEELYVFISALSKSFHFRLVSATLICLSSKILRSYIYCATAEQSSCWWWSFIFSSVSKTMKALVYFLTSINWPIRKRCVLGKAIQASLIMLHASDHCKTVLAKDVFWSSATNQCAGHFSHSKIL